MLHYIENGSSSIQMEAMDTLLSMLVDSEEIQSEFRKLNGIHRIVALLKNKEVRHSSNFLSVCLFVSLCDCRSKRMRLP
jgi:putative heme degradation protein